VTSQKDRFLRDDEYEAILNELNQAGKKALYF